VRGSTFISNNFPSLTTEYNLRIRTRTAEAEEFSMAKRKNQASANGQAKKKRAISDDEAHKKFRNGLFDSKVLEGYTNYYAGSQPYVAIYTTCLTRL